MGLFSKKKEGNLIPGPNHQLEDRIKALFAKVESQIGQIPPGDDFDAAKESAFLKERQDMFLELLPREDYRPLLEAFADFGERATGNLASLQFAPVYSGFKRSVYDFPIEDNPLGDPRGAADCFTSITASHMEIVMLEERIASIRKRVERLKAMMAEADPGEVLATLRNLQGEKLLCEDRLMKAKQSLDRMRKLLQMALS